MATQVARTRVGSVGIQSLYTTTARNNASDAICNPLGTPGYLPFDRLPDTFASTG